jgi:hypothetical protein
MRLPSHETGFDLANSQHPARYRDNADPPQVRREEPTAVTPHGGIRGGESQQWLSYPTMPQVRFCAGGPVMGILPQSEYSIARRCKRSASRGKK